MNENPVNPMYSRCKKARYCIKVLLFLLFVPGGFIYGQTPGFPTPGVVCGGVPQTFTNPLAAGGANYYWNFCSMAISTDPVGANLGNIGNMMLMPTYVITVQDGADYYAFVCNHDAGTIIRLFYGNSLLNTPVAYNLGQVGGTLPNGIEGLQIHKDNGTWYGVVVGGNTTGSSSTWSSRLVVINFGANLANNNPTATNYGNIGNFLNFPMDVKVFKEGTDWLAFITNFQGNTMTRVSFGNSLGNVPTAVNLGNLGNMSAPSGICEVKEGGQWYFLVANRGNNTLTRLSFGASLLNTPVPVNIGNPGTLLSQPKDLQFLRTCDGLYAYVMNEGASEVIKLQFAGDTITGAATATNLGNLGNMNRIHHASDFFRVGDTLYSMVPSVTGNTISRLAFGSCVSGNGIPSVTGAAPVITFPYTPAVYPVNVFVDEGLPTQQAYCGSIVVENPSIDSVTVNHPVICDGNDGSLVVHTSFRSRNCHIRYVKDGVPVSPYAVFADGNGDVLIPNLSSGSYDSIQVSDNGCKSDPAGPYILTAPVAVSISIETYPSTHMCVGDTIVLGTSGVFVNPAYLWSTGMSLPAINVTQGGMYWLEVTDGQCSGRDSITVTFSPRPSIEIGKDSIICAQIPLRIGIEYPGASYLWNTGATTPYISVDSTGAYVLNLDISGCRVSDTVNITAMPAPNIDLGPDRHICPEQTIVLDATYGGNSRYLWHAGDTTATYTATSGGTYWVTVTTEYKCVGSDSVALTFHPKPVVSLGPDTSVCEETPLVLRPGKINADSLIWSDGSTGDVLTVKYGGEYIVTGINKCGTESDTMIVTNIFCDIWVPNAFTPNGDGMNDVFRVLGNTGRMEQFSLSIFNRWGERMFQTHDRNQGWDGIYKGGGALMGTYVYMLEYSIAGKPVLQKGNFHLLR